MAKYTIELGKLINSGFNIFDDSWTTYIPEHKKILCERIIRHYYFNEIGAETPERFRFYINEQLSLNQDRYNKLYESSLYDLLPLYNTVVETERKENGNSKNNQLNFSRSDSASIRSFGESLSRDFTSDKWGTLEQNVDKVAHETGNLTGVHTDKETIETVGTKDSTDTVDKKLNQTDNSIIKETRESTETVDDDTTGKTTGTESQSTTRVDYSSDTPQGKIINDQLYIDSTYLTNYTHGTENKNRNYSESSQGTDDKTTTLESTLDKTDDLTREITEHNTDTYTENTTSNTTKNDTKNDTEDTTRDLNENTKTTQTTHDTEKALTKEFRENTERLNSSQDDAGSSEGKYETESTYTQINKGNIGVSRARLILEYRNAILNVDELIIKELAVNFMGVF